jgi:hypothetical protein
MNDAIYEQIMAIRKMPNCPNMFDTNSVQQLANSHNFFELVIFIEENKREYSEFILSGKWGDEDE